MPALQAKNVADLYHIAGGARITRRPASDHSSSP
jgi:hypothetical protein